MRRIILITFFLFTLTNNVFAQNQTPKIGCKDPTLLVQSSELKDGLIKQGFEVINDAMLSMESKNDFPVLVRMQSGIFYQIIFIGNTRSKKMNLTLFDINQQPIIIKEQQPLNQTSNTISFSFTPSVNGDYTFILSQSMKKEMFKPRETVCGSFTILRLKKKDK